jgi:5'-deoxynucleotidase
MLTIKDKMRSRNQSRWHTVSTAQQQNVAEHSHCGGILAEDLLIKLYLGAGGTASIEEKYHVLKYFQMHDLPELITGDWPTPIKRYLEKVLPNFKAVMHKIELQICPELAEYEVLFNDKPYLKHICKAADMLEALSFFLYAQGLDKQHNEVVFDKLRTGLTDLIATAQAQCPHFDWSVIASLAHELEFGESSVINFETLLTLPELPVVA